MHELSIKEKQAIILDIMKDIDKFCRENDIRYTISSGTLLGAVRHGGFIPWDDDADMFMLREDFDRFVKIYKSPKYHLLFNTCKEDEFLYSGFAKINDPTTYADRKHAISKFGIFVDVFPLDAVPEEPKERRKYMHKVISLHNRIHHRQKKDLFSMIKSYRHSLEWWNNRLEEAVRAGANSYVDSPLVAHLICTNNYRTVINRDRFDSLTEIQFEGHNFMAFSDPHSYLSMVYGENYMTPKKWIHDYKVFRE